MSFHTAQHQVTGFSPAQHAARQSEPAPSPKASGILCPSQRAARTEPQQMSNVSTSFASLFNIASAEDIRRASNEFAATHACTAFLPQFNVTPPLGAHPLPSTYAAQQAQLACGTNTVESFNYTQIGDLIIWTASDPDGNHLSGLTYVAPSNILSADLVMGIYRVSQSGEANAIPEDCIARFTLLCHCIAVPKTRAFLMDSHPAFKSLNRREKQVLTASADGATAREVAEMLFITERTVHAYVQSSMEKLKCTSKLHAIMRANRLGLI